MGERNTRIGTRSLSEVSAFSALLVGLRLVKIPIHVPGFGGILWITTLIVARGCSSYPLIATWIGLIAGIIITVTGIDFPPGPQQFVKYVATGIVIDLLFYLLFKKKNNVLGYATIGIFANLSKLTSVCIIAYFLGMMKMLKMLSLYIIALHIASGIIIGVLAYYTTKILRRTKISRRKPS